MLRMVLQWVNTPWAFELHPGLNTLGRNPTNDFKVSDPSVSSFHAEITVDGESVRVRDLGSTNGTFLDGKQIEEGILTTQNSLRLGSTEFKLEEVIVSPAHAPTSAAEVVHTSPAPGIPQYCAYHQDILATYKCENCGGLFCEDCVKVVGHDRAQTMTLCPVCKGQCDHLPTKPDRPKIRIKEPSLLGRLTQTLKLPIKRW
jgi:pSer/pThr/pTyr-binding forkhead associated (FHA) protein